MIRQRILKTTPAPVLAAATVENPEYRLVSHRIEALLEVRREEGGHCQS